MSEKNQNLPATQAAETWGAIDVYRKMSNPLQEATKMGEWLAKSGLAGTDDPATASIIAIHAVQTGTPLLDVVRRYDIVEGKLRKKSDTLLAEFKAKGGRVKWTTVTDDKVAGTFSYDGDELDFGISMDDIKAKGYCYKNGTTTLKKNYKNHSMEMLKARVVTRAMGFLMPEAKVGTFSEADIEDMREDKGPPSGGMFGNQPGAVPIGDLADKVKEENPPMAVEAEAVVVEEQPVAEEPKPEPKAPDTDKMKQDILDLAKNNKWIIDLIGDHDPNSDDGFVCAKVIAQTNEKLPELLAQYMSSINKLNQGETLEQMRDDVVRLIHPAINAMKPAFVAWLKGEI